MKHGGDRYKNRIDLDFSININTLGAPKCVMKTLAETLNDIEYYPDYGAEELTRALSERVGVPAKKIALGNGASELLMAAAHAYRPEKVLIPVPSFYGYEYAMSAVDAQLSFYEMREAEGFSLTDDFLEHIDEKTDMLVLANPNNPTGRYIDHMLLDRILEKCAQLGVTVLLDECFMELSDEPQKNSVICKAAGQNDSEQCFQKKNTKIKCFAEMPVYKKKAGAEPEKVYSEVTKKNLGAVNEDLNLLILRSFTKTFAIPGLRLGYLVGTNENSIAMIKRHLPEWNISVPAQIAGYESLKYAGELAKSRELINEQRRYLKKALEELGFYCIDSDVNYILFRYNESYDEVSFLKMNVEDEEGYVSDNCENAVNCFNEKRRQSIKNGKMEKFLNNKTIKSMDLYKALLEKGILIRDCSNFRGMTEGWYRIAVRSAEENRRLAEALKRVMLS